MDDLRELPMGFGMALMQNQDAANYFHSLSEPERQEILSQAHQITSKEDMQAFVNSLKRG